MSSGRTGTERDELAATLLADARPTSAQGPTVADEPAALAGSPPVEASRLGTIGRFRLDGNLGSGGMGDVYRAYDPALDRAVALKLLRSRRDDDDPQRRRRVLREARAAAALTHPNTVTIFDVGEADGEVFIAMELLEGDVLRAQLERQDVLLAQKLRWLLEAARALGAAHERGLVHRDVKPDNMFITRDGVLKLLDFGIAKRGDDESLDLTPDSGGPSSMRTAAGRRLGTPRYMAPEQHASASTDARTDEYAWGVVAFELLTGVHPSEVLGTTPRGAEATALANVLRTRAAPLSEPIVTAVTRALEEQKEARFPSMAPIVAALESSASAGGMPTPQPDAIVAAAAVTVPPRRRRAWLAPLLALTVLAAGGSAYGVKRLRERRAVPVDAPALPAVAAPACRVVTRRSLPMSLSDRFAVLPNGEILTARNVNAAAGLKLMLELPPGPVPFSASPMSKVAFDAMGGPKAEILLRGARFNGDSWLIAQSIQNDSHRRAVVAGATTGGKVFMQAVLSYEVTGVAEAEWDDGLVVAVTTRKVEDRTSGAMVYASFHNGRAIPVEEGDTSGAALATKGKRVAFAYLSFVETGAELHLALLDDKLQRLGDAHVLAKISQGEPLPAAAFSEDAPIVFWVDDRGARTRLMMAMLPASSAEATAAKVAIDEPAASARPLTARLPDGRWVVAWLATSGGTPMLRVAPIGAGGELGRPADVAPLSSFTELHATAGDHGIELSWLELGKADEHVARFASITCGP